MTRRAIRFALSTTAATLLAACATNAAMDGPMAERSYALPAADVALDLDKWPVIDSAIPAAADAATEARIDAVLSRMTVEEKVGQILQPEITNITPDEVREYNIGSVLNGGNGRPNKDMYAPASEWLKLADAYWTASTDKSDGGVGIPIIWGIDSVHGNNSYFGGTIFPHNIGLGAANDPDLMRRIGRVTAIETAAIGTDWTFAPALSIPRDDRWGRTYEGYSEGPEIAGRMGASLTLGLQGDPAGDFFPSGSIIATAKHMVADGGTAGGRDQGDAQVSEDVLRDIHWAPYAPTLEAGAQTVMASYSKWNGVRMHGHGPLLTTMMKDHAGFDGFVIGDFNGHALIPGCTAGDCPEALLAGVDMYMIPADWKELYNNLVVQVKDGTIPMSRLDDAVRRVLRVKFRAGLFDMPKPSARPYAGAEHIGTDEHKALAREAARKSAVLLKDDPSILPFPANSRVLVAGQGADNVPMLVGGWSMNWQGTGLTNKDFPGSTTVYSGLRQAMAPHGGTAELSVDGQYETKPDYAVVVFGETPYAEYQGDRESVIYAAPDSDSDLALLERLKADGIPVIAVFLSGRPLWVNPHLNASDAFVAAWLPGTQGGAGLADLLVSDGAGKARHDFTGRLSFSWPKLASQTALNQGNANYDPLFPVGYGLSLNSRRDVGMLSVDPGLSAEKLAAASNSVFFSDGRAIAPWRVYLGDAQNSRLKTEGDRFVTSPTGAVSFDSADRNRQEDTKIGRWSGTGEGSVFVLGYDTVDFGKRAENGEAVVVSMALLERPTANVTASFGTTRKSGTVDLTPALRRMAPGKYTEVSIPLACFADDSDLTTVDMPLRIATNGKLAVQLAGISIAPPRGITVEC
ncbi:glycoside hydrolase family 3 protein [Paraurantiacibacter namhicola]|uniref:Periplasmic beta-glucosidase n=1 Tax=Paraurantiacibacter namhicola TaxID=645517 RepID=A0A1C7D6Z0_9SPHN|nr:glycoside hydrolase family 3 protein [Paraurantiacibacter namhicola]ANU07218.1 Periplasmic beta-glucosidase precursor [Paraurantiacibacter namhicola]